MELLNIENANQVITLCEKYNVQPMKWFDFSSWIGDLWFKGILTWDQMSTIKDKAFEINGFPGSDQSKKAEYLFGAIKYAYDHKEIVY